ncbi:alpha/beta hydrolase [Streptomyces caniscabiei]|uniref:alpha/beta fold hydrolase n=1 Tax=Streptomyces caniscabiei TaxID=2746961 RepID=UPI0029AB3C21|nr:alpha/beta hydrolase [Streptomyces caniscabiei]MDX2775921.1 alpha/beta hydrolase [Streptomyces caniscabiei]
MGEILSNPSSEEDVLFRLRDGRTMAARVIGPEYGVPILTLHGSPGSRLGPHVGRTALIELGVRLIAPDRPGYGLSDPNEGRTIADTARDIGEVMDQLEVERFEVVGRSGGTPYALAVAALHGARISGVVSFASLAPKEAPIDWTGGMTDDNKRKHEAAIISYEEILADVRRHAAEMENDPNHMIDTLWPDLKTSDKAALIAELPEEHIRRDIILAQKEGFRQGGVGWGEDTRALHADWGIDLQDVKPLVTLWHGAHDPFAAPMHSTWLSEHLPNASLVIDPDGSHMTSYLHNYSALEQLRDMHVGADAARELRDQVAATREQIYKDMGTSQDAFTGGEVGTFSDAEQYANWRAAKLLAEASQAAVVRNFLTGIDQ